ncbi:MAG: hypothetical protein RI988_4077 [Pseudomonadota bacterium]|jgi:hypothetical protein
MKPARPGSQRGGGSGTSGTVDTPDIACTCAPRRRTWMVGAGLGAAALAAGFPAVGAAPAGQPGASASPSEAEVEALLRRGGVVFALRHARAPGTFDPPGMRLDDCATQRNLDEDGRTQARRIGQWFSTRGLKPVRVRSSPWCRCQDTARLAYGAHEVWPVLGSPHGQPEAASRTAVAALRAGLDAAGRRPGAFEVWVTHMFVISALTGESSSSGEGLVLAAGTAGAARVLGRLAP